MDINSKVGKLENGKCESDHFNDYIEGSNKESIKTICFCLQA